MKKILITGGSGVVGSYVQKALKGYTYCTPSHAELDITNLSTIEKYFAKVRPEFVIHLAAKTNVDECEKNPTEAYLVNAEGTKNIATICKKFQSFLVYLSTAAVFDGKKKHFLEDDNTSPVNIYGKSKLAGEQSINDLLDEYLIIRAAWVIGGSKKEKKFVSYIIDQIKNKDEIMIVNDKFGTITYAKDLADFIVSSIKAKNRGVYHFAAKGICSRYLIAKEIISFFNSTVELIPVSSSYFSNQFSAPRPDREIIISKKISPEYTWKKTLRRYLQDELKDMYV